MLGIKGLESILRKRGTAWHYYLCKHFLMMYAGGDLAQCSSHAPGDTSAVGSLISLVRLAILMIREDAVIEEGANST